jgi:hypothetical protein
MDRSNYRNHRKAKMRGMPFFCCQAVDQAPRKPAVARFRNRATDTVSVSLKWKGEVAFKTPFPEVEIHMRMWTRFSDPWEYQL